MSRPSEPFNAEERDLAQRLARLGGPREPAAALDAMILAAARAAVSDTTAPAAATPAEASVEPRAGPKVTPLRPRKPAPRWPLGFGLAASVVLAAGIGWRLQIDGNTHTEAASAPAAVFHDEATEAVILEPPLQRTPPPPPPPLEEAEALARRADMSQAPAAKAAPAPFMQEPDADVTAAESLAAAEAAPAPAAPPAPVAEAIGGSPAADASLDKVTVTGSRISQERATGAAEYTRTPLNERREQAAQATKAAPQAVASPSRPAGAPAPPPPASNARARSPIGNVEADTYEFKSRDGYDDRPPVSADSPEFRQAWLQRIRVQIAKGDTDAAREGLQEFRRRYPDVELPEDLRKLAATLPPPTP